MTARRDDPDAGQELSTGRAPKGERFNPDLHCVWANDEYGPSCPYMSTCDHVCIDLEIAEGDDL